MAELIGIADPLEGKDLLPALMWRRGFCQFCIRTIDQMDDSTPLKDDALHEYKLQLAGIDKQIEDLTGQPPPVVVQLKTAKLFGEAPKLGE